MNFRLSASHTFTNLSSPAETRRVPSVLKATLFTGAEWPFIIVHAAEALLLQILTVLSREHEAIKSPRPLTVTSVTGPL